MAFLSLFLTALAVLQVDSSYALVPRTDGPTSSLKPVIAAYYSWHENHALNVTNISWRKYNTLIYSFATTTPSVNNISLEESNPSLLPQFVEEAHKYGVSAHVAVAGWTGGLWFSSNVATAENRTAFVKTVTDFAQKYKLDGIDFDWEYPNRQGIGCNVINPHDTENFLSFLKELRADPVGRKLTLSAAASITPWNDASGKPSKDVSGFAKVLDYISIMNYDVWGSWSTSVGPNSPLNDTCAAPANQQGSAVSAVKAWSAAGMAPHQIVLGVASYGHSFSVSPSDAFVNGSKHELAPYPKFNAAKKPVGDAWSGVGGVNVCGVKESPGDTYEFWALIEDNFLNHQGYKKKGIYQRFDNCSQTPYVYNEESQIMVSYDDPQSFTAKGQFIKDSGLRGFSMWEAAGDYHNILLRSITKAAGFNTAK